MIYQYFLTIKSAPVIKFILISVVLCFLGLGLNVQNTDVQKFEKAKQYYRSAYFDQAIEILKDLTSSRTIDHELQKESLRILSRAFTAKGLYDQAKESIRKLLELEPPMIEFNPDCEPPPLMKAYYEARKSITGSYQVERPDPGMKTMAIIDFKNSSIDGKEKFDPMEKGFADLLIHRLNYTTTLKVIERERIQWIFDAMNIQDQYSMDGAVRMGKQLGVHTILFGSFIIFKNEIWLGARLVKVETGELLLTDEVKGNVEKFFDLSEKLGQKIAAKVDATIKEVPEGVGTETRSLDAIMSYSEGLTYLEYGEYNKAYEKFREALKYDSKFEKAKIKAESIEPYIGYQKM